MASDTEELLVQQTCSGHVSRASLKCKAQGLGKTASIAVKKILHHVKSSVNKSSHAGSASPSDASTLKELDPKAVKKCRIEVVEITDVDAPVSPSGDAKVISVYDSNLNEEDPEAELGAYYFSVISPKLKSTPTRTTMT